MTERSTPPADQAVDQKYGIIDLETGEVMPINVQEANSGRWDKVWAKSLADLMDLTGDSRTRVIAYLLRKKNSQNVIYASMRTIAGDTGVSLKTVNRTIKQAIESHHMIRLAQGVIMFSPHVIQPGSRPQGMAVLRRWKEAQE